MSNALPFSGACVPMSIPKERTWPLPKLWRDDTACLHSGCFSGARYTIIFLYDLFCELLCVWVFSACPISQLGPGFLVCSEKVSASPIIPRKYLANSF